MIQTIHNKLKTALGYFQSRKQLFTENLGALATDHCPEANRQET